MRTVLVVDSCVLLRQLMAMELRRAGFIALKVANGVDALQLLDAYPRAVRLVVSNARLDGMDGLTLSAQVRLKWPGIKVLLIGVEPPSECDDSFMKEPVVFSEFLSRTASLLERRDADRRRSATGSPIRELRMVDRRAAKSVAFQTAQAAPWGSSERACAASRGEMLSGAATLLQASATTRPNETCPAGPC